jgi:beta-N-acetylhexosaminidase
MSYQDLLDKMTLAEKVGQMFMLAFSGDRMDEAQVLMEVNLVGAAYISNENVPTPEAAYNLTTTLGEYANNTRLKIPQLLGVDQEGAWSVMYPASTPGPGNMAIGATGDPQMAYRMYEVIGRELRAVGLNTLLAPCADCNANPMNAIIGMRSFGEKPGLVGIMTATAVRGAQASGVVATVKHYPGHGDTTMDSHRGLPIVDRSLDDLNAVELHPFREGVSADVGMVMTAHIIFPALDKTDPATLSAPILRGVLREQMGFDGVILSDSMNMMAMKQNYDSHEAAIRAFNAGVDVLMLAEEHYDHDAKTYLKGHQSLIQAVITAATDGTLSMARVDDAVRRILALKDRFGLQLGSPVPREEALALVGSESHRAVELEVAQGAISVLRNQHDRLPLASDQPFVLIDRKSVV